MACFCERLNVCWSLLKSNWRLTFCAQSVSASAAATLTTTIIHHAPQTKAETLIRTLSQDTAAPRFTGLLQITKGNQGCESYLNHHSLLLGTEAKSWTTPSLEILNNEVKCSHAATIRTITPFDLFYLQSRGLPATEAQNLLIEAFLADVQS
jgi:Fe-S cluster assembly protein SufD